MGMFGKVGHAALNQAGIMLLGRNFDAEAERRQRLAQQAAARQRIAGLFGGQAAAAQTGGLMPQSNLPPMTPPMGSTPIMPEPTSLDEAMSMGLDRAVNGAPPPPAPAPVQAALPSISDPATLQALMGDFQYAPEEVKTAIEVMKANQPRGIEVGGRLLDQNDRGAYNKFYGKPPVDGAEPVYDRNGNEVGWRMANGAIQAASDMAGAVQAAKAAADAGWDVIPVNQDDGSTVQMPRAAFVRGYNGAGAGPAAPGGAPPALRGRAGGVPAPAQPAGPRLGVSQTPAAASAAKIRGDALATAQTTLPSDLSGIDSAIENVNKLIGDPGLKYRTGALAMLPAMPGTHGVAVDALKKQITGQIFLDAYTTLRGGGQITEVEGKKATQAKARMDSAQTYEDYVAAAKDYVGALQRGRDLLLRRAGGSPSGAAPPAAPAAAQRQANTVYQTPRGPMKWTGTGWLPAN